MCAFSQTKFLYSELICLLLILLYGPVSFGQQMQQQIQIPDGSELSTQRIKNDVTQKVEEIVGDLEDEIMGELKGELSNLVTSTIADYLNVSPNAEVKNVIKTLKEGLSKEQKIVYQDYRVTYEWRKAHMDLTESLPDLYEKLHITERFQTAKNYLTACDRLRTSPVLSGKVPAALIQELKAMNLQDLADRVRAATNTSSKAVWMSTAERILTLKEASRDLDQRLNALQSLHSQLQMAYSQHRKQQTDQQWVKSVMRPSSLNRSLLH